MDARSAREWSSEAAARPICPNGLRRCCCISEETGDWLVCDCTDTLVTCAVYMGREECGANTIGQKHQGVVSTLLSHSMCPNSKCRRTKMKKTDRGRNFTTAVNGNQREVKTVRSAVSDDSVDRCKELRLEMGQNPEFWARVRFGFF